MDSDSSSTTLATDPSRLELVIDMPEHKARAFLRQALGPQRRELEGKEREQVLLMLAMLGSPTVTTNNQHCYSEDYVHAGRHWCVTTWPDGYYTVEEIERENS
jgi:hypothetical protein